MSYISVYSRSATTPNANGHSALNIINESDTYEELFLSVGKFDQGIVKVYDTDTMEPVGTIFPSGRITLRTEYVGD